MAELPEGFVIDTPESKLPEGFVLDRPASENSWLGTAKKAVTGVPEEALRTTQETMKGAAQDFRDSLLPRQGKPEEGFWEGYGRDLAALPGRAGKFVRGVGAAATAPLAPVFGAGKSLIGRPLAHTIHSAGEYINPEEAAKHTPEDIYQDIREDVGSALGTTSFAKGVPTNAPKTAIPSLAERKAASKASYNHPDVKAVEIKPTAVQGLASVIEGDLITQGFRPVNNNSIGTFRELKRMRPRTGQNAPILIDDLDAARRALGKYAKQTDNAGAPTTEASAAATAISHIDDFLLNLKQTDLNRGNAGRVGPILQDARKDWASFKREQLVDNLQENAAKNAASTYGGGNQNNAIRQAFRPYGKNNFSKLKGWTPEAKAAVDRVVSGGSPTSIANMSRQLGRLSPSGPVGMGLHAGTAYMSGGWSVPVAVAAYTAKKLGLALTRSNVNKVREILGKESALYQARQAAAGPPTIAKRTFAPPAMWGQIPGHDRENALGNPGINPYAP